MIVKYIYVKDFNWAEPFNKMNYEGHFKNKEVYRAIYHPTSNVYSVIFREVRIPFEAIVFDDLKVDNAICTCEMVEITKENILELNITEKELDKMIKWMETKNEDINPPRKENNLPIPFQNLFNEMKRQESEDTKLMFEMNKAFDELNLHNTIYCELILALTKQLKDYTLNTIEDAASELELDGDRGLSVNIAKAMRSLQQYALPLRRGGEEEVDLDEALFAIFREKERRVLNNIL